MDVVYGIRGGSGVVWAAQEVPITINVAHAILTVFIEMRLTVGSMWNLKLYPPKKQITYATVASHYSQHRLQLAALPNEHASAAVSL